MAYMRRGPKITDYRLEELEGLMVDAQRAFDAAWAIRDKWQKEYRRKHGHVAENLPDSIAKESNDALYNARKAFKSRLERFLETYSKDL